MRDDDHFNPVRGEMAKWQAVITQALMDAASGSAKPETVHVRSEARRWLLGHSRDFITVCLNAGLEPDTLRMQAMRALERGCKWRAEPSRQ